MDTADLRWNAIGAGGCQALADARTFGVGAAVRSLQFYHCCCTAMPPVKHNSALISLRLSGNGATEDALQAIGRCAVGHTRVHLLTPTLSPAQRLKENKTGTKRHASPAAKAVIQAEVEKAEMLAHEQRQKMAMQMRELQASLEQELQEARASASALQSELDAEKATTEGLRRELKVRCAHVCVLELSSHTHTHIWVPGLRRQAMEHALSQQQQEADSQATLAASKAQDQAERIANLAQEVQSLRAACVQAEAARRKAEARAGHTYVDIHDVGACGARCGHTQYCGSNTERQTN